jgi:hypothetical protein
VTSPAAGPPPHAAPVNAEFLLFSDPWDLRATRLALDMLIGHLPAELAELGEPTGPSAALLDLHDRLCREEMAELARTGSARHYLIIRPVNLVHPPSPGDMQRISAAIRVLAELGMLAGHGDAR